MPVRRQFGALLIALFAVLSAMAIGYGIAFLASGASGPRAGNSVASAATNTPSTESRAATSLPSSTNAPAADVTSVPAVSEVQQSTQSSAASPVLAGPASTPAPPSEPRAAAQPAATSTPTPEPTSPPTPTAEPTATNAPSPIPTAVATTPTPPASIEPTPVQANIFVEDTFSSPNSGWPSRETPTWSSGYHDGQYYMTLSGEHNIGISYPASSANFRLSADVRVQQGGAGLLFLFSDPATFYRIVITSDGAYAVQRLDGEAVTNVIDWTDSPALRVGAGAINRLRVERQGGTIRFFANGQPLTEYTVPSGTFTTRFGFVLTARSGRAEASFDNLIGERLPSP